MSLQIKTHKRLKYEHFLFGAKVKHLLTRTGQTHKQNSVQSFGIFCLQQNDKRTDRWYIRRKQWQIANLSECKWTLPPLQRLSLDIKDVTIQTQIHAYVSCTHQDIDRQTDRDRHYLLQAEEHSSNGSAKCYTDTSCWGCWQDLEKHTKLKLIDRIWKNTQS